MENYLYQCQYCGKEYKPNRRHKQIFCSNSCRTNSHIRNKKLRLQIPSNTTPEVNKPNQIETMSLPGVLNAAAGTVAVNVLTNIFTKEENKPATKRDIKEIKNLLSVQHHLIKNYPNRFDGARPFYDMVTQSIVYINK